MKALADFPIEFQTYVRLKISAPELAALSTGLYRRPPDDQSPAELIDFALAVLYESWLVTRPERHTPTKAPTRVGPLPAEVAPPAG